MSSDETRNKRKAIVSAYATMRPVRGDGISVLRETVGPLYETIADAALARAKGQTVRHVTQDESSKYVTVWSLDDDDLVALIDAIERRDDGATRAEESNEQDTDCTCVRCVIDRSRSGDRYIATWRNDGAYFVGADDGFYTRHRERAIRFGINHVRSLGTHLDVHRIGSGPERQHALEVRPFVPPKPSR